MLQNGRLEGGTSVKALKGELEVVRCKVFYLYFYGSCPKRGLRMIAVDHLLLSIHTSVADKNAFGAGTVKGSFLGALNTLIGPATG